MHQGTATIYRPPNGVSNCFTMNLLRPTICNRLQQVAEIGLGVRVSLVRIQLAPATRRSAAVDQMEVILWSAVAPPVRGDAALIQLFMSFVAPAATIRRQCAATKCRSAYDTHCNCPSSSLATGKRRKQCHCS